MKNKCETCPFHRRHIGEIELANMVEQRYLTKASQICHHPSLFGKKETHLCRGARDYQLTIFYRLGIIKTETDKAWNEAIIKIKEAKQ